MKNLFSYLNQRTIFEHLLKEETNTGILGSTFHPFTIDKWVLESEIQNISIVENLSSNFSGFVYIKDTKFWNYNICSSSRFSNISFLKFAPKLQSYISNDLQNFMLQNLSYVFHVNFFQPIFTIWSQPERGVIHIYIKIKERKMK